MLALLGALVLSLWASPALAQGTGGVKPVPVLVFFGLFGIIFFPIAAWFIVTARPDLRRAKESAGWPRSEGQIVGSEVKSSTDLLPLLTKSGEDYNAMSDDQRNTYVPAIRYSYAVDGTSHEGETVQFGLKNLPMRHAQALVDRFPVGKAIPVSYDPADPKTSVLEPVATSAAQRQMTGFILAGVPFLLALGVALALHYTG